MRIGLAPSLALMLLGCSTPEESQQRALMDLIEKQVQLPQGARPLDDYARYYAYDARGDVIGLYMVPMHGEVRPGETCDELLENMTSRPVPCPPNEQLPDTIAAGERRWVANFDMLPGINDGGCIAVNILFDRSKSKVKEVECNGAA